MRRSERKHAIRRIRPSAVAILAVLVAWSCTHSVRGQSTAIYSQPVQTAAPTPQQAAYQQTPAEDGARFRAYKLNHLDAATAQQQLAQFFTSSPGTEIVADAPRSRVLVRGDEQVLRQAGEILAKMDVLAATIPQAGPNIPPPEPPTMQQLETYPLTPAAQTILSALEKQAAGRPDVRVAVDPRTSQILVLAPDMIHNQIRSKLAQAAAPQTTPQAGPQTGQQPVPMALPKPTAAPPANNSQPAYGTLQAPPNLPLQLRNVRADDLRVQLERLLARPLPASSDNSGQWQTFEIEAVPGAGVTVTVNPTTGQLHLTGPPNRTAAWRQVISALDSGPLAAGTVTQLVSTKPANQQRVRQVLQAVQSQGNTQTPGRLTAMMQQQTPEEAAQTNGAAAPTNGGGNAPARAMDAQTATDAVSLAQAAGELLGPVQIEFVEGLDVIVLRGADRDVERVMQIIEQIEQLSAVTTPTVEIYPLKHVDSRALGALLTRLYQQVLTARIGDVSITPLVKPNALLLVGRPENVRMAVELIQRLDVPIAPTTRFEVFPLKNASAAEAKAMIDQFLTQTQTEQQQQQPAAPVAGAADATTMLAPRALVVADVRTNSLIVSAAPGDLAEVATLVGRIDSPSGAAVDQVRVFPLRNAVATELAVVLRSAIQGQAAAGGDGENAAPAQPGTRPSSLEFRYIGDDMQRELTSGVLTGARISADARANSIIVTAPADSMDLIAALIQQLDQSPNVAAELKVFTLENGDAATLVTTLRTLFGVSEDADEQQVGGVGAGGLVRMQFSVDARTNSIIAAGTRQDLAVVEAVLLRLDEGDVRERTNVVYRLNNASAQAVSETLNAWLQTQRTAEAESEVALSPFEQIEREVIIVPEIASNSLVVSATPRYFEQVRKIIAELDERPPMVMIQVLIAEVRLNDTDEFGLELGLQDSLLFDRSLVDTIQTTTNTVQTSTADGVVTNTSQNIINAPLNPGFNFNNTNPLGNNGSTAALATAANVATQGLTNFAMGRANPDLGFGGFIFSASSNGVNVLLRALQEKRRLEVLSRPQIMALDGQPGYILVGQRVPTITGVSLTTFGQTNDILYQQVGIIMQVVPRISPDGLVVMQLTTEKSEVGPEAEGIPISVSAAGQIVRAPRINATTAVTTVSALSGQTVVLSGLLTNRREDVHRRVPLLADIPLLGDLFRYDRVSDVRTELLIVMTPQIIRNKLESDLIKQTESQRMSYIMSDVVNLAGDLGLRSRCDYWCDGETEAVYPTYIPGEDQVPIPAAEEMLPPPAPPLEPQSSDGPTLEPALSQRPSAKK
jgi:general secretion pathway protein D